MKSETAFKFPGQNRLEGFTLTAILQAWPAFSVLVVLFRLVRIDQILGKVGGVTFFLLLAVAMLVAAMALFGQKHPAFRNYQPVFFDASLTCREKVTRWWKQPTTSVELLTLVMMLAMLAIVVLSNR